ncbi:MAG: substrate-binding domain-containing protein [Kiritimatiellia bacterium]|jgi:GntR family transcriptional regulator of arabinose operon
MKNAGKTSTKYKFVFETLRKQILAGDYSHDQKFPSELMLARRFKVSRPTISRALLDLKSAGFLEGRVGSGTYLGPEARAFAGYIGMIIPDRDWNMFFSAVANAFETAASKHGFTVLKDDCFTKGEEARAAQMAQLAAEFAKKHVRGILVAPFDASEMSAEATHRMFAELEKSDIPIVLLDRDIVPLSSRSRYDLVSSDNFAAGRRLAAHFIAMGAKRLAFLTIPHSGSAVQERIIGFAQTVRNAGLPWTKSSVLTFDATNVQAVQRLFSTKQAPDAIGCRNDHVAAYLLQTLANLKIDVPKRVRIGAFDDCKLAQMLTPPLTSVHQPTSAIADAAFTTLLERIRNPSAPARKILLDVTLSVRASSM